MKTEKALVLGDDTRSFLTVVRSLGRCGINVDAAPANFRSPSLRSRYIVGLREIPPWLGDGSEWLDAITRVLTSDHYQLVIPCNEASLLPLCRNRGSLSALATLAIPDERSLSVFFDKNATRELAQQLDVATAPGRVLTSNDTADALFGEFGTPIVVKPRHSYSLEFLAARGRVHVIEEPRALASVLARSDPPETIVERFFCGRGIGVSILANRGRILQAFEHHRVREIAGASFYRRSAPLTPALLRACEVMAMALQFTGLAMFEFKQNSSGAWVLLEVNARPWGSIPLPVSLGVNFPYRWYRLLTAGEESAPVPYRTGIYGRNLIPDLNMLLIESKALGLNRLKKAWFLTRKSVELLRVFTGRERHDVLVRDDPGPALAEFIQLGRALGRRAEKLAPGQISRRKRRARTQVRALLACDGQPRVIFVCHGNICRSPFAEALLRVRIGHMPVVIGSAGIIPQMGRSVPSFGLNAARSYGVDLSVHRSRWLDRQAAEAASILIVFDERNREAVLDRYPDLPVPILLLGDLVGGGAIEDPVDGDPVVFGNVYAQIATGIRELAAILGDGLGRRPGAHSTRASQKPTNHQKRGWP